MEENKDAANGNINTSKKQEWDDSTDKDSAQKNAAQLDSIERKRAVKSINKLAEDRANLKKRVLID